MTTQSTREAILAAARRLFYAHGAQSVGVDAVARKAGVTKPTLYYYFKDKDHLVAAYAEEQGVSVLAALRRLFDQTTGPLPDRIGQLFNRVADSAEEHAWRGCPFQRIAAEFVAEPRHPARLAASAHKKAVEAWFIEMLAVHPDAERTGRQILTLLDGATAHAFLHRDASYIRSAAELAKSVAAGRR
jgi:AcrR family transcriptional regulator